MHKRGLCCHPVSVCLSVTFVDHVKTNKRIFEIFSPSGSDTILVFPYQKGCRYSDGNPPNGGVKCKGGMKNPAFRPLFSPISRSILQTVIVRWAQDLIFCTTVGCPLFMNFQSVGFLLVLHWAMDVIYMTSITSTAQWSTRRNQ